MHVVYDKQREREGKKSTKGQWPQTGRGAPGEGPGRGRPLIAPDFYCVCTNIHTLPAQTRKSKQMARLRGLQKQKEHAQATRILPVLFLSVSSSE